MLKKSILFLCAFSLFIACKDVNNGGKQSGDNGKKNPEVNMNFLNKVKAKHKDMVTVISEPTTIVGVDLPYKTGAVTWYFDGVFVKGRTVDLKPYQIGKWEVSYELWCEVIGWALNNDYKFLFQGGAGSESPDNQDKPFIPPTEENKWQPVVWITWRSALVWCNAYSEMLGLRPCYYKDAERTLPIRSTEPCDPKNPDAMQYTQVPNDEPGYVDAPYVDWNASGFRLPTEAEWEMAARGGDPKASEWVWKYPTCNNENELPNYAWIESNSGGKTHNVGEKNANKLGLHDMSGNACEWCFDWVTGKKTPLGGSTLIGVPWYGPDVRPKDEVEKPINSSRVCRSCSFEEGTDIFKHTVGFRFDWNPTRANKTFGFRVARTLTK